MKNPFFQKVFVVLLLLTAATLQAARPRPVEVIEIGVSPRTPEAVFEARVQAPGVFVLRSEEEGRLLELKPLPGSTIRRGEPIGRIDDRLLRAELAKAEATRRQAEVDLQRQLKLRKSRVASEDDVLRARTALTVAEAEEALLRSRLARTRLTAPLDATVTRRLAEPGMLVTRQDGLLELRPDGSLEIHASLPPEWVQRLAGLRFELLTGDTPLGRARLRYHEPVVHEQAQLVTVVLTPEEALDLLPGTRLRVRVQAPPVRGLWVPLAAVRMDEQGPYLMRYVDGRARRTPIRPGETLDGALRVLEGLSPGQRIILRGLAGLRDGDAVRPVGGMGNANPTEERENRS